MDEQPQVLFDFVMSVGPACRPAQQLKEAGLRFTAAPMDWMELYPLNIVTHLFQTSFSDFFTDIREEAPDPARKNRRVVDVANTITSIHHFPTKKSLAAGQKELRRTMLKRYHRIDKLLRRAQTARMRCWPFCQTCAPSIPKQIGSWSTSVQLTIIIIM